MPYIVCVPVDLFLVYGRHVDIVGVLLADFSLLSAESFSIPDRSAAEAAVVLRYQHLFLRKITALLAMGQNEMSLLKVIVLKSLDRLISSFDGLSTDNLGCEIE